MATDKMPVPEETVEQQALFRWAAVQAGKRPELRMLYAIPNGGKRHKATAVRLKKEGVKPGVPDIALPIARGGYHGLYIELKRRKGGRVTPEQDQWLNDLRKAGYMAIVSKGWEEAAVSISWYLSLAE